MKTVGLPNVDERAGQRTGAGSVGVPAAGGEGPTRAAIVQLLLEEGPITATAIGKRLGLAPAGVRRHLDALIESGQARAGRSAPWQQKGRGRPAKQYQLTATGRGMLGHAYDDLATAAIRQLRELGGEPAVQEFARRRARTLVDGIEPLAAARTEPGAAPAHRDDTVHSDMSIRAQRGGNAVWADEATRAETVAKADEIAEALTDAGFAASTRRVGAGVQICQHHCPVSHVAEEFPQLCEAELTVFRDLLGIHVQRLATIANGDCACTTHVPLTVLPAPTVGRPGSTGPQPNNAPPTAAAQPATDRTNDSGRSAE